METCQFPQEFTDIIVGVDSNNDVLKVVNKATRELYQRKIHIHRPGKQDYWFRWLVSNDLIAITDYDGLRVYNSKLDCLFSVAAESLENVVCFEIFRSIESSKFMVVYWNFMDMPESERDVVCIGPDYLSAKQSNAHIHKYYIGLIKNDQ